MKNLGIEAERLMSGRSASEEKMIWEKCLGGAVRLLYVTPEKVVQSKWFLEMMQKLDEKGMFKRGDYW